MINLIILIPRVISRYFKRFKKVFSQKMTEICLYYLTGLFLEHNRFNLKQLAQKAPNYSYQSYQYFLSEAKWDEKGLNLKRIKDLNRRKQTKSSKGGVLILDDTSNKKSKNCKKTDTVARQYSTKEEAVVNSQVSVYTAYADVKKSWPVDLKPYWPEEAYFKTNKDIVFKSKIELGMELIEEATNCGIKFSHVVFDSWYLSNEMIIFCQDKKKKFISTVDVDRWMHYSGRWIKGGELVKLAQQKRLCVKPAKINTTNGQKVYFYCEFEGKLKGIPFKLRFILTRWQDEEGQETYKLLVTNDLRSPAKEITLKYSLRWAIEVIFERLKEYFYLDQFQVVSVKAFSRHYYLAIMAYSFILIHLMCGSFSNMIAEPPKTFEQALKLLRDLITLESYENLNGNVRLLLYNKDLRLKSLAA